MNTLNKALLLASLITFASAIETETQTKKLEDTFCAKVKSGENFCMEVKTEYPIIWAEDKGIEKTINHAIQKNLTSIDAKKYVQDYIKEMKGDISEPSHSDETTISLLSITPHTFTLINRSSTYSGGAHGNYGSLAKNYDLRTGEELPLKALFVPNYEKKLTQIAEMAYRLQEGLMPDENLTTTMGWFDNKFILPSSIGIREKGLVLDYNPYEIRAYAYGLTSLLVPYGMLSSLIPNDSYLSPLIQNVSTSQANQTSKIFGDTEHGEMNITARMLGQNRIELSVTMQNNSDRTGGALSLSFPTLESKNVVESKLQSGFNALNLYPKGSRIYHRGEERVIDSKYLLVEAESKIWKKGESKNVTLTLNIPHNQSTLYLNARATFGSIKALITVPDYGIEGQQGFYNYRFAVSLK